MSDTGTNEAEKRGPGRKRTTHTDGSAWGEPADWGPTPVTKKEPVPVERRDGKVPARREQPPPKP